MSKIKSYVKCSKCDAMIQKPPKHRKGRCDKCWILCLEDTICHVASQIIDNAGDTLENRRRGNNQSLMGFRYAIVTQLAFNLLAAIGRKHKDDNTDEWLEQEQIG